MLTGFPLGKDWQLRMTRSKFGLARWNPYVRNWPITLEALRNLWEAGKVSELKSPFYEPVEKPAIS